MTPVRRGLSAGSTLLVVLLAGLHGSIGLTAAGWIGGLACGTALHVVVRRAGPELLGPADLVTIARATLGCGVAALVVDSFSGPVALPALVALSAVALALDAVDGRVARLTHTESAFGARFDGEADAFLILVLSVYVARERRRWVLAIGAARYVFGVAGWWLPWLRAPLPARYWRKVVAAVQGVVLLAAPRPSVLAADARTPPLVVALALLAESFGRDVLVAAATPAGPGPGRRLSLRPARLHP